MAATGMAPAVKPIAFATTIRCGLVKISTFHTRTATEYGVVRTFADMTFTWTGGGADNIAGGWLGVYYALGSSSPGSTLGKAIYLPVHLPLGSAGPGNNSSYLIGGDDTATGVNQIAYTAKSSLTA